MKRETYIEAIESLTNQYTRTNSNYPAKLEVEVDGYATTITITLQSREGKRRAWVSKMLEEYRFLYARNSRIIKCDPRRKIMAVYFCDDHNFLRGCGVSLCSPDDEFDRDVGLAVAFARFCEYPIPDYV